MAESYPLPLGVVSESYSLSVHMCPLPRVCTLTGVLVPHESVGWGAHAALCSARSSPSSAPMDFVAVPPGTAAPVALTLRGSDPDLDLAPGDDFITALGNALSARNVGGGGRRAVVYSAVSGVLSGYFFGRRGLFSRSRSTRSPRATSPRNGVKQRA